MRDFVSSHRVSVFVAIAALSVAWVVCSILLPQWVPWMGLGWVGLGLCAALWRLGAPSDRSIAQVLRDEDAQPLPVSPSRPPRLPAPKVWALVACSSVLPALAFGGPTEAASIPAAIR
jgi:hypothetical protein